MSFVKHREYRAGNPTGRANESLIAYGAANGTQPQDDSPGLSGLYAPLYFFLGAEWLLVFMGVSDVLGAGIGALGGKFLESKLRMRQ
jgi:hypothetical protein